MVSLTRSAARYVSKLSNNLRRKIDALSSHKHFSGSEGRTLHFILAQTEDVYQKDIEEEYSIRPPTASALLKQMEQKGFIIREPDSRDNRLKKITVTPKALVYKKQVIDDLTQLEEDLVRGIREEDLEVFFKVIRQMMKNIGSEDK